MPQIAAVGPPFAVSRAGLRKHGNRTQDQRDGNGSHGDILYRSGLRGARTPACRVASCDALPRSTSVEMSARHGTQECVRHSIQRTPPDVTVYRQPGHVPVVLKSSAEAVRRALWIINGTSISCRDPCARYSGGSAPDSASNSPKTVSRSPSTTRSPIREAIR